MVVGRRRVAAASVATAYALHVYVLPNTIFDRPSLLFRLIPIAQKFVCTRVADTSRGCWYRAPSSRFSRPVPALSILYIQALAPSVGLHVHFSHTYTIPPCYERHAGKRRVAPRRTPSLTLVYPRLSTHCSHSFSFASYLFCSYYSLVSQPYARIEAVYIAYCGLSRN